MQLKIINDYFSVCKVKDYSQVTWESEFVFIGKTDEECSLVCQTDLVPENVLERDDNWKAFRVQGVLDFSLIGILSHLSGLLAQNNISIFAVSTYNTDYILIKEEQFDYAITVLKQATYEIVQ